VVIEAGAEGFVTRSKVFPEVAKLAGVPVDQLANQIRIADNELVWNIAGRKWEIGALEPGVAAQKLGFQVPKEDRGRGIRSFRHGMSQLVDAISQNISDVRLNTYARDINVNSNSTVTVSTNVEGLQSLIADHVVLATPLKSIRSLLETTGIPCPILPLSHHSHVSVHALVSSKNGGGDAPKSFTVPAELQQSFGGLRAVSFVNEKFPNRCSDGYWLFRLYYRPSTIESALDESHWISITKRTMKEVYGIEGILWSQYSPWVSQLPTLTPDHLSKCKNFKEEVAERSNGRIHLIGSEVSGAGLEAAATSGYDAASKIIDTV
jgi:oxygen-dependent protoporphyrinogen oxidase